MNEGSVTGGYGDAAPCPLWQTFVVASVAAGIQFGWALQLSLLTPYVEQLGVPHVWASFIWLCGPISGLVVQPTVGHFSDRSTSRFGRRRPFILVGALLVAMAVFLIGFAADIGHAAGDKLDKPTKPRAVAVFVVGFWILDVANNMLQGPCRALLADLSAGDEQRIRYGNYSFAAFMALGNVLGYGAGTISNLHKIFPFATTTACDTYCANLKTCFIIDVVFLLMVTINAIVLVKETPLSEKVVASEEASFFAQFAQSFKQLSKSSWILFAVTALNWIGWFPFILYDTDWMGMEVYGGKPQGTPVEKNLYDLGVRKGAMGLLLNSVVLGGFSVLIMLAEQLSRWAESAKTWWGIVNLLLTVCLALTVPITKAAEAWRRAHGKVPPSKSIKNATIGLFSALGVPLAVTYSVPFALASIYSSSSGAGQGLSLGLLNLSIVIPQMFVSVVSGRLDELLGGGNIPAFIMGAIAAFISALMALFVLPNPSPQYGLRSIVIAGGH